MSSKTVKTTKERSGEKTGRVICAWCGEYLGEKEGIEGISHSICKPCKESELQALRDPEEKRRPALLARVIPFRLIQGRKRERQLDPETLRMIRRLRSIAADLFEKHCRQ